MTNELSKADWEIYKALETDQDERISRLRNMVRQLDNDRSHWKHKYYEYVRLYPLHQRSIAKAKQIILMERSNSGHNFYKHHVLILGYEIVRLCWHINAQRKRIARLHDALKKERDTVRQYKQEPK